MTQQTQADPSTFALFGGGGHRYPFTIDEDDNVTGYGHQPGEVFAAELDRWDDENDTVVFDPDGRATWDVAHTWVVLDGELLLTSTPDRGVVTADTPGAIPVTTVWGQR